MIDSFFSVKTYKINCYKCPKNLELSPELIDICNDYFIKEENINQKHLLPTVFNKVTGMVGGGRLLMVPSYLESLTFDMNLPEDIHVKNIVYLYKHLMTETNFLKNQKIKNIPSYPYILRMTDTNVYILLEGRCDVEYDDQSKFTILPELNYYGWRPYTEPFIQNKHFWTEVTNQTRLFNLKMRKDSDIDLSNMNISVGVMSSEDGKNTLSYSSSEQVLMFLVDGDYDVSSGIDASITNKEKVKFPSGCNFTITHTGTVPTVVLLLERK